MKSRVFLYVVIALVCCYIEGSQKSETELVQPHPLSYGSCFVQKVSFANCSDALKKERFLKTVAHALGQELHVVCTPDDVRKLCTQSTQQESKYRAAHIEHLWKSFSAVYDPLCQFSDEKTLIIFNRHQKLLPSLGALSQGIKSNKKARCCCCFSLFSSVL